MNNANLMKVTPSQADDASTLLGYFLPKHSLFIMC